MAQAAGDAQVEVQLIPTAEKDPPAVRMVSEAVQAEPKRETDNSIDALCRAFLAASDEQAARNREKISLEHGIQSLHNSLWSFAQPFSRVEGVCGCGNRVNYVHSYQTAVYNEATHADMVSKIRRLHDVVSGPWLGAIIKQHQQRLAFTLAVAAPVKACSKERPSQQYAVLCSLFDSLMAVVSSCEEAKKDLHLQRLVIYVGGRLLRLAKSGTRVRPASLPSRAPSRSPVHLIEESASPSPVPIAGDPTVVSRTRDDAGPGGVQVVLSGSTGGGAPAGSNVDLLLGLYAAPAAPAASSRPPPPPDDDPFSFFNTPAGPADAPSPSVASEAAAEEGGDDSGLHLSEVHGFLASRIFAHSSCAAWAAPLLQPTVDQIVRERWLQVLLERDWSSSTLSEADLMSCLAQVPWLSLGRAGDSSDISLAVVRPLKQALEHFCPLAIASAPMHPLRHLALTLAKLLVVTGSAHAALAPECLDVLVHGPWPCKLMAVPLAGFMPLHAVAPDTLVEFFGEMYMLGTTVQAVREYAKKFSVQRKVHRDTFVQGVVSHNALVSEFYSLEPLLQKVNHSAPYPHLVLFVLLAEHYIRASRNEDFGPTETMEETGEKPKRLSAVQQWGAKWQGTRLQSDEWLARLVVEELFYFAMLMQGRLFASAATAATIRSESARWLGALCQNVPSMTSVVLELLVNNARDITAEPRHLLERLPMASWQPDPYILDKMQTLLLQRPANPQCLFVNCPPTDTSDETITHWINLAFAGGARPPVASLARSSSAPASTRPALERQSQRDSELHVACALFHDLRWERCPPAARIKALLALLAAYPVVPRSWWWAVLAGPVGQSLVAGPLDRHFAEVVVSQLDRAALDAGSVCQMTAYVLLCIGVAASDLEYPETVPPAAAPGGREAVGVAWLAGRRLGQYLEALARDLDHSVATYLLARMMDVAVKAPDEFAGVLAEAIDGCVRSGPGRVTEDILRVMDDSLRPEHDRERVALEWALALSHPSMEAEHGLPLLDSLLQHMYYEGQPLGVLSHAVGRRLGPVTKDKLIEYVEGGYLWVAYTLLVSFGPAVPSLSGTAGAFATPARAVRQIVRTLSRSLSAKATEERRGGTPRGSPTNQSDRDRFVERQERVQPGGLANHLTAFLSKARAAGAAAASATGMLPPHVALPRGEEEKDPHVTLPDEDGESLLGSSAATPARVRDLADGEPDSTPVQPRTELTDALLCGTAMGLFREIALALGPSDLALPFWEQFFVLYLEWSPAAAAAGYDTKRLEEEDCDHFQEMAAALEQFDRQLSGLYWAFTRYTSELLPGKGRFLVGGGVTLYMDKLQARYPCRLTSLREEAESRRSVEISRRPPRASPLPPTSAIVRIPNLKRDINVGRAPLLVPAPRAVREADLDADLDSVARAEEEEAASRSALEALVAAEQAAGPADPERERRRRARRRARRRREHEGGQGDLLSLEDGAGRAGGSSSSSGGEATSATTDEEGTHRHAHAALPLLAAFRRAISQYHTECTQLLKTDESMLLFSRQMYNNVQAWFTVSVRCLESEECAPAALSVQESTISHGALHAPELTPVIDLLRSNRELYQKRLLALLDAGHSLARCCLALGRLVRSVAAALPDPAGRPSDDLIALAGPSGPAEPAALARARALFFTVLPLAAEESLPAALQPVRAALAAALRDLGARAVRGHAPSQHRLLAALLRARRRRAPEAAPRTPGAGESPQQPGTLPPSPGAGAPGSPGSPMPVTSTPPRSAARKPTTPARTPGTPRRGTPSRGTPSRGTPSQRAGPAGDWMGEVLDPASLLQPAAPAARREYLRMLSRLARRGHSLTEAELASAAKAFDADGYMDALSAALPGMPPADGAAELRRVRRVALRCVARRGLADTGGAFLRRLAALAFPASLPDALAAAADGARSGRLPAGWPAWFTPLPLETLDAPSACAAADALAAKLPLPEESAAALVPLIAALTIGCPALLAALHAELEPPLLPAGPAPPQAAWQAVKRLFAAFLRPWAAEGPPARERARKGRPSPSYLLGVTAHGSGDTSEEGEGTGELDVDSEPDGSSRSLGRAGSSERFLVESTLCRGLELVAKLAEKVPPVVSRLWELYLEAMPPLCSAGAPVHAWSSVRQHVRSVDWSGARFHVAADGAVLRGLWEALPSMDLVACELFNALSWEPLLTPEDAEPRDEALLLFLRIYFSLRLLRRRELSMRVSALVRRTLDEGEGVWDRIDASRLCAYFDGTTLQSIVLRGGEGIVRALATPDAGSALLEGAKMLYSISVKRRACAQSALAAAREAASLVRFSVHSANQSWIVQPSIYQETGALPGGLAPALTDLVWRVPARERLVAEVLVPLCERFAEPPHPPADAALLIHHLLSAADPAALPEPAAVPFAIPSGAPGAAGEERPTPPAYVRSDGSPDYGAISSDEELYAALSAAPESAASGSAAVAAAVQRFCAGITSGPLALEMLALIPHGVRDVRATALLLEHTLRGYFAHAPASGPDGARLDLLSAAADALALPATLVDAPSTRSRRRLRRRRSGEGDSDSSDDEATSGAGPSPPPAAPSGSTRSTVKRAGGGGGAAVGSRQRAGGAGNGGSGSAAAAAGLAWRVLMDVCRERRCCVLALVVCERQRRGMEACGAAEWGERALAVAECISYFTADPTRPFDLLFLWLWLLQLFGDLRWDGEEGSPMARLVEELDAGLLDLVGEGGGGGHDAAALKNLVARAYLAVADSRPAAVPGPTTAAGILTAALEHARRPVFGLQLGAEAELQMRVRLAARALRLYLHHVLFRKREQGGGPNGGRAKASRELLGELDELVATQAREPYAHHAHAFRPFFAELGSLFGPLADRPAFARALALLFPDVPYLARL